MRLEAIPGDADDLATGIRECSVMVPELDTLGGATRRGILGVEIEDEEFAVRVRKLKDFPACGR